ncbi:hypothetical protein PENDEC_c004G05902 [Penicillium decumbens]|uniref:Uncharacterized protein n=1 Tax=Penicillium decumbens TaxID=69771 RepID=A0A1V6PI10_PENDC|nr:hypothetical protein PENDEC_c004G05902 [Penicillium decumbens]
MGKSDDRIRNTVFANLGIDDAQDKNAIIEQLREAWFSQGTWKLTSKTERNRLKEAISDRVDYMPETVDSDRLIEELYDLTKIMRNTWDDEGAQASEEWPEVGPEPLSEPEEESEPEPEPVSEADLHSDSKYGSESEYSPEPAPGPEPLSRPEGESEEQARDPGQLPPQGEERMRSFLLGWPVLFPNARITVVRPSATGGIPLRTIELNRLLDDPTSEYAQSEDTQWVNGTMLSFERLEAILESDPGVRYLDSDEYIWPSPPQGQRGSVTGQLPRIRQESITNSGPWRPELDPDHRAYNPAQAPSVIADVSGSAQAAARFPSGTIYNGLHEVPWAEEEIRNEQHTHQQPEQLLSQTDWWQRYRHSYDPDFGLESESDIDIDPLDVVDPVHDDGSWFQTQGSEEVQIKQEPVEGSGEESKEKGKNTRATRKQPTTRTLKRTAEPEEKIPAKRNKQVAQPNEEEIRKRPNRTYTPRL